MAKCTDCQYFIARFPWIGHCGKVGCPADYGKSACGKFRQASLEKLKSTEKAVEFYKNGDFAFKCKETEK